MRKYMVWGALSAGLAVAFGAFGAHALSGRVSPDRLRVFETGVHYQMYHALALMFVGWLAEQGPLRHISLIGHLFAAGTVLFSGSLYLLVITNTPWPGALTPLGGIAFLLGWGLLAHTLWQARRMNPSDGT